MFPPFISKVWGGNPKHVFMELNTNFFWYGHAAQVKESMNIETVSIPVLLPHEVLHAVWHAGEQQVKGPIVAPELSCFLQRVLSKNFWLLLRCAFIEVNVWQPWQFRKSMMGTSTPSCIEQFWNHCRTCEEWADHPVLQRGGDLGRAFSTLNLFCFFPIYEHLFQKPFNFVWGTQGNQSKDSYQSHCIVMVPNSFAILNILFGAGPVWWLLVMTLYLIVCFFCFPNFHSTSKVYSCSHKSY